MGIYNCKKHGVSDFIEVCVHIDKDLQAGFYPKMNDMPALSPKVCDNCYELLEFDEFKHISVEDLLKLQESETKAIEKIIGDKYDLIPNRQVHCINCVEEIKNSTLSIYNEIMPNEFDWFAIDYNGNYGLFSSAAWGDIPKSVFINYKSHNTISKKFELPDHSSEKVWQDFANYGLYVFDWKLHKGPYELVSKPTSGISENLKKRLSMIKSLPKMEVSFETAVEIEVTPVNINYKQLLS